MDILIITVLIIAAVILFLVELFVIPGISLAGISALVCIIYANYYAFANLGMAAGFITLGISGVACIGSLVWFMRSKMLDKLALKKDIDSKVDRSAEDSVKVGDTGISTTRLAQIGYAEINGNIVEVKSIDGFLNEKTETYVTEDTYEIIRLNIADIMAEKDDYLEVFLPDMAYSDQPIKKNISEDLADIYQDIRDFIFVFQLGLNETMNDSLAICQENFGMLWGQKLVNTLRALHDVKYNQEPDEEDEIEESGEDYEPDNEGCNCENDDCHCEDNCDCHDHNCHCHDDK